MRSEKVGGKGSMGSRRQTLISSILKGKLDEKTVSIRGWLHRKRSSGGILFLLIRDGTGILQCTLRKSSETSQKFEEFEKMTLESTVEVTGTPIRDKRAPRGYEMRVSEIRIINLAEENYPIAKKYHGPEFILDHRHLFIRNEKAQGILKIRASLLEIAREWFKIEGYTEVQMPILITAAVEGGSTLFEVKYFDTTAYLTQSWQLYAEATIASLGRIYTIAPSFRAEKSRTRRHLTEYWHLEVEEPWCTLEDTMQVQEKLVSYICQNLVERHDYEFNLLGRKIDDLRNVKPPFQRLTYDDALKTLINEKVEARWGDDLTWEQERHLALKYDKPFFITHYPTTAKAFYHKIDPKSSKYTLSADMLAPEGYGEIIGGGERIDSLRELEQRIKENKLNPQDYKWYVDLRRFGTTPHAGFGLGVERLIAWICKLEHIRDAITFPRLINRIYP